MLERLQNRLTATITSFSTPTRVTSIASKGLWFSLCFWCPPGDCFFRRGVHRVPNRYSLAMYFPMARHCCAPPTAGAITSSGGTIQSQPHSRTTPPQNHTHGRETGQSDCSSALPGSACSNPLPALALRPPAGAAGPHLFRGDPLPRRISCAQRQRLRWINICQDHPFLVP